MLDLDVDTDVFELERLRIADGKPLMFERTYIPERGFEAITIDLLEKKPLYDVFAEDFQEAIRLADEEFYASIALDYEAKLLGIKKGDPVLHIMRKTYNEKNRLIEFTFSIARADQFRYRIQHHPNKKI
ncbi:GntR family transcriptional regulator [Streptococcus equi subsp. equi]|nr:GntR family transcriptional regulator [Streptococcus equi subsp. equi]